MADASCSSSNAFKGLARHLEQDRSHQQDRVAPGPQRQVQGFRSTPLHSGLPDQFDAFQRHNATLLQHPTAGWQPYSPPADLISHPAQAGGFFPQHPAQQPSAFATNAGASWVNDFGRMGFAEPRSNQLQTQSTHGPLMGQQRITGPMHSPMHSNLTALQQQQTLLPFQSPAIGLHPVNHQSITETASLSLDAQTEAMFDQEFEDAMNEWMLQNGPAAEIRDQNDRSVQDSSNPENSLETTSTTPATQDQDTVEKDSAENPDELARAAQQLVDSLADNNSEKFKNSNFLTLMRRIASQELTVQGNDLVETQPDNNSTPQIATSTSAAPSTVANELNSTTS
ncbi:hypothetical protein NPX13_g4817 [Xylaria arbuscula]|uniref:Peroxin 20 n=1 Tax=Xylaria arbuscula TaxID=114810 RepID=A0A9W8TLK5_9PEZI|nr:hypothetical protein NPX13_g4817 [Xylaria arbuscula]